MRNLVSLINSAIKGEKEVSIITLGSKLMIFEGVNISYFKCSSSVEAEKTAHLINSAIEEGIAPKIFNGRDEEAV